MYPCSLVVVCRCSLFVFVCCFCVACDSKYGCLLFGVERSLFDVHCSLLFVGIYLLVVVLFWVVRCWLLFVMFFLFVVRYAKFDV